jgi:hypothetical protein
MHGSEHRRVSERADKPKEKARASRARALKFRTVFMVPNLLGRTYWTELTVPNLLREWQHASSGGTRIGFAGVRSNQHAVHGFALLDSGPNASGLKA